MNFSLLILLIGLLKDKIINTVFVLLITCQNHMIYQLLLTSQPTSVLVRRCR